MQRLTIIVASADSARLYAALEAAMAWAALGRRARIFAQGEAVALLRAPLAFDGDAARRAAGQLDLAAMLDEAAAMEVELVVCQSGMALAGLTAPDLPPQVKAGGLVSLFAGITPDERLIVY
ncbi:DsrE family protein [Sphingopyxis sp. XHP0097]|uniref:DsrE family protein n=1 Tax=Sphingopyxis jiangsuensis TaxID=2871171 RepID=A0ABS7MFC3_9SPHN|nr:MULTISPECIES: DsrE family protein [Sphingopyxis]MBL0769315.1 DsrE family protein [Sphingopyxis lutea]MBY4637578.1 DsrE family protein [Sphingopyxis jiangsuensis]